MSREGAAVSTAGAVGPMQLMPTTTWQVLRLNPWRPRQNILGGARFLRQLPADFRGNLTPALEAYNAGPNSVSSGASVPPTAQAYARLAGRHLRPLPMPPQWPQPA